MNRSRILIMSAALCIAPFSQMAVAGIAFDCGVGYGGESQLRGCHGEDNPNAAVFSAKWPRRDKIKPEKPFAVSISADTSTIKLNWQKNLETDLKGYRIYRSVPGKSYEFKRVNKRLFSECSFKEAHPASAGSRVLYKVTAVDRSGNESESVLLSIIIPDRLAPKVPQIEDVSFRNRAVYIRWKANTEKDLKGYWLFRVQEGIADSIPLNKNILPPSTVLYLDRNIFYSNRYKYYLIAEDSSGLRSVPSASFQIDVPSGETSGELIIGLKAGYDSSRKAVNLSFNYQADINAIKGFIILRSNDRNNFYPVSSVLKSPVFTDNGIDKGSYFYKVNILTSEGKLIESRSMVTVRAD